MVNRTKGLAVVFVMLFFLASAAQPAASASNPVVWTIGTGTKIQPFTAVGSGQGVVFEGARKSYDAYQVVVTAGSSSALTNVNLIASSLSNGLGGVIPASNLTFFREGFIDFTGVNSLLSSDGHGNLEVPGTVGPGIDNLVPDPLIPFIDPYSGHPAGAPFTVSAATNQPVWIDAYIPANAASGTYTGTITVTADAFAPVSVPVTLTVWDLTLPDMSAVPTWYGLQLDNIIQYHAGTYSCSGSSCWRNYDASALTISKRYEELAHDHRIDTGEDYPMGNYGYNPCPTPADWTAYDAAMQPYMDGTYWADGVPSTRLDVPFSPGNDHDYSGCSQASYTATAAAWAAHLRSKGWLSRALAYSYDEPSESEFPAIEQDSQWMQAGDPAWLDQILVTKELQASYADAMMKAVNIFATALAEYDNWGQRCYPNTCYGRTEWPGLFAQGVRLWLYESNNQGAPWPTYATDTLLGNEPRIMKWAAWYEGASGFLFWQTLEWDPAAPWGQNAQWGKTGDGMLIYPGNHNGLYAAQNPGAPAAAKGSPPDVAIDGPIPSYRLKMVRAGLQDWALFSMAKQYGLDTYAHNQVALAYTKLGGCSWDGCALPPYWDASDAIMIPIRHNIAMAIVNAQESFTHFVYLPLVIR